jgi:acetyl esterase
MQHYVAAYLNHPGQATEPYASPLFDPDPRGLPSAWIMTCEFDPLRSDGEAYAKKLQEAGVPVHYQQLAGHIHPSFAFNRLTSSSRSYLRATDNALRAAHRAAQRAGAPIAAS